MNAYCLRKPEIQYELKIRGQSITGTAEDLRKRLSKCFRDNLGIDQSVVAGLDVMRSCRSVKKNTRSCLY